jgi:hypothetical protein
MELSNKDKLGIGLIVGCALLLIAAIATTFVIQNNRAKRVKPDPTTLCPYEQGYSHTVVLIDWTDPLSDPHKQLLRSKIQQIRQSMRQLDKLSIYVLDDKNYLAPIAAFAVCNPGSGKDVNPLYENPRMAEKLYQERFGKPLGDIVEKLSDGATTRTSPILEMIHSISQVFDFGPKIPTRRLVIFSDLMHNMPEYSQFTGKLSYDAFRVTPYAKRLNADLTGVSVEVVYLLRPELYKFQSQPSHQSFWGSWFEDHGAKEISFQRTS